MKLDLVKYSLNNLLHRRLRSWLTMLSILIGVMAIFALASFGLGVRHYIDELSQDMGTDKIMMQPKTAFALSEEDYFTQNELEFIRKVNGVGEAAGMTFRSSQVYFKDSGKIKYVYSMGLPTDETFEMVEQLLTVDLLEGRTLKDGDVLKATVGYNYGIEDKVFKRAVRLGDKLHVNGVEVEVVGIYEEIGNPSDDSNIYLTFDGFEEIFGVKEQYGYIAIRVGEEENASAVADKIEDKFRKYRGEKSGQETFTVQTFEEAVATFSNIINGITGILLIIALVSLIVAGINIMNTMYTAVVERTKEIGIMKAIGARNKEILFVFILEAGMLGLAGGLIGIGLGYLVSKAGGAAAAAAGYASLRPYFPWWLIAGCLAFALLVGSLSGLPPSIQASKQNPVESLRYE
ncbi:ABC transporter permease [Candidatus Woesearchaeota archaeon]|nr:ABC transporter permease [Candidatus Woesearchaeota archaeon]